MATTRRRVFYAGRVQGVGFRATVHHLAQPSALEGFVRNLADGRVEMVAQGELADIEALMAAIDRAFQGKIRDADIVPEPVGTISPPGFHIRYD